MLASLGSNLRRAARLSARLWQRRRGRDRSCTRMQVGGAHRKRGSFHSRMCVVANLNGQRPRFRGLLLSLSLPLSLSPSLSLCLSVSLSLCLSVCVSLSLSLSLSLALSRSLSLLEGVVPIENANGDRAQQRALRRARGSAVAHARGRQQAFQWRATCVLTRAGRIAGAWVSHQEEKEDVEALYPAGGLMARRREVHRLYCVLHRGERQPPRQPPGCRRILPLHLMQHPCSRCTVAETPPETAFSRRLTPSPGQVDPEVIEGLWPGERRSRCARSNTSLH